jgi:fumarate reductase flavoprotein subunit
MFANWINIGMPQIEEAPIVRQQFTSTRRNFLYGATAIGTGAAGLVPATISNATPIPPPPQWDRTVDVVVAGGGAGGLLSAAMLAQGGMSVILLEKEATTGGSSAICGGQIAFAGTDMQKALGIEDSPELLTKDLLEVGQHLNDVTLVKAYADHQLETYQWLKNAGARFTQVISAGGSSVPRMHVVDPGQHLVFLRQTALKAGADILDSTPAERLIYDQTSKTAAGVLARGPRGETLVLKANRAVVLATGGYSRDKQLLALFTPPMKNTSAICGAGSNGDGLRMGWAFGGGLADVAYVKATFGFRPNAISISKDFAYLFYKGAIIVNQEGKRFVNESISYKLIGDAAAAQTGGYGFQIYDEPVRQIGLKEPLGASNPSELEKSNAIMKADTIAELAAKIGIAASVLQQTINEYNANVAKGVDPLFGRTALTGNYGKPTEIKTPPFYAYKSVPVIVGTYAGLTINDQAQVVDVYGDTIPGLYAIGEVTGGFHGAAYMSGSAFGKTQVFGLIAAHTILNHSHT